MAKFVFPKELHSDRNIPFIIIRSYSINPKETIIISSNSGLPRRTHNTWILPLSPGSLQTKFSADFSGIEGANDMINIAKNVKDLGNNVVSGNTSGTAAIRDGMNLAEQIAVAEGSKRMRQNSLVSKYSSLLGVVANKQMSMTYNGPDGFRTHTFTFSLIPKDSNESKEIQSLIKAFRESMLPQKIRVADKLKKAASSGIASITEYASDGSSKSTNIMKDVGASTTAAIDSRFYGVPDIFSIQIFTGGRQKQQFMNIKPSALIDLDLNFETQNMPVMTHDGFPLTNKFTLTFKEMTQISQGDLNFQKEIG